MKNNTAVLRAHGKTVDSIQMTEMIRKYGLLVIIAVLCIIFTCLNPVFVTPANLLNIVRQGSVMIIFSVGITFVLIGGVMDLSVSGVACVTSMIAAIVMDGGGHPFIAAIAAVLTGMLFGFLNGILVTKFKLNAFIVTLATQNIAAGATLLLTNGTAIYNLPKSFVQLGRGYIGILPMQVIIMAVSVVISAVILGKTVYGRRVYAIGGNKIVAKLSGISVDKHIVSFFVIASSCAAVGGLILTARTASAQPIPSATMSMDVITSVVIGGTSLNGGKGKIVGSLLGALLLTIITNGLTINSVSSYWQSVISAVILVLTIIMYRND